MSISYKDHCKSVHDLMNMGIDCYMSNGTMETLGINHHRAKPVKPLEPFKVGSWVILPFRTEHDASDPYGFLLANRDDKVLFASDTFYLRYRFKGLTCIMVECNYSMDILKENVKSGRVDVHTKNRIIKSHMSLQTVKEFLKANDLSRVKEIHLIHLSSANSCEERFKREVQAVSGKPVYVAGA